MNSIMDSKKNIMTRYYNVITFAFRDKGIENQ